MTTALDTDAFDDFVSRVDLVQSTITGLRDGTVSLNQSERVLADLQHSSPHSQQPPHEEQKEQFTSPPTHRSGPGVVDDYSHYCPPCRIEFLSPFSSCLQCHRPLLTRDARHAQLKTKVARLQEEKTTRRERRQRFLALKEARKQSNPSSSPTSISPCPVPLPSTAWDDFEPSSSSSDDDLEARNPAFAALSSDLNARNLRRQQHRTTADHHKALGNAAYASHDFPQAVREYTQAIELVRSEKVFYANRAAARVRMGDWEEAIKDCGLVLDIWEFIDRGDEKRRQRGGTSPTPHEVTVIKALTRRAEAYRATARPGEAKADLTRALQLEVEGKRRTELLRLLHQLTDEEAERTRETMMAEVPTSLSQLIEQLKGEGLMSAAVIKRLTAAINSSEDAQVAFRTKGGLDVLITRLKRGKESVGVLTVLVAALCNDKNKDTVQGEVSPLLLPFLSLPLSPVTPLACTALALLTERESTRTTLRTCQPPALDLLLPLLTIHPIPLQEDVLTIFANLALTTWWKAAIRDKEVLGPALVSLLLRQEVGVVSAVFSLLANLCTQTTSHSLMAGTGMAPAFAGAITRAFNAEGDAARRAQANAMAVLLNVSTSPLVFSPLMLGIQPALTSMVRALSAEGKDVAVVVSTRVFGVLAKVCGQQEWREKVMNAGAVQCALRALQAGANRGDHERARGDGGDGDGVALMEAAVKVVAACCHVPSFPAIISPHLTLLPSLLSSPSPFLAGNAALLVSALSTTPLLPSLRPTLPPLLLLLRKWSGREGKGQADAANNAAVACARLAKDGLNLEVIRTHGGMALLMSGGQRALR